MGAWIEIATLVTVYSRWSVAPLVGAWIEIIMCCYNTAYAVVAPLVGAWIEIYGYARSYRLLVSLPLWERGLKWLY